MQILNPLAVVLKYWVQALYDRRNFVPVYDPTLTYEKSLSGLVTWRHAHNISNTATFPIFAYNRRAIRWQRDHGRKGLTESFDVPYQDADGSTHSKIFRSIYAETEVMYRYYSDNIVDMEEFELLHALDRGFNEIKEFSVEFPIVGDVKVFLDWSPLEDLQAEKEPTLYQSVAGTVIVRTNFFLPQGDEPMVETIHQDAMDWMGRILINRTTLTKEP